MTKEDINDIINAICPNDEDYEKPCISPKYLRQELEQLALDQRQWNEEPTTRNDLASESMSKEMIAARTLESINEGFNKERLLDSWFGNNRKRDAAFKRAILALRAMDKIEDAMEEYLFNCLDLPSVAPIDKECPNCDTDIKEVRKYEQRKTDTGL